MMTLRFTIVMETLEGLGLLKHILDVLVMSQVTFTVSRLNLIQVNTSHVLNRSVLKFHSS